MSTSSKPPRRGDVIFVGTGISLITHATSEAVWHIKNADKVLFVASEPAAAVWIRRLNSTAESLSDCYAEGKPRVQSYREMVDRIVGHVKAGRRVCVALYGHPGVGADPTHMTMTRAKREGFSARILPGISADACLFADLSVDPLAAGCQSYEASHFIHTRPAVNKTAALVLWQIGMVQQPSITFSTQADRKGVSVLARTLACYYPDRHPVVVYQASLYAICPPIVKRATVGTLSNARFTRAATLYVPPLPSRARRPRSRK